MGSNSQVVSLLYIVGLFAILYFLMIRPQQQRQKKHQEMISNVKENEKVITIGGLYGTIVRIKDKSVILEVAENVRVEFLKTAISQVINKDEGDTGK